LTWGGGPYLFQDGWRILPDSPFWWPVRLHIMPALSKTSSQRPETVRPCCPELSRVGYRPQGWLSPVLLVDGRMEGVWRHERKGKRLAVRIEPFGEQPGWVRRAAEGEAERLSQFLGGELDLVWSGP
jgi:hypothetical protein